MRGRYPRDEVLPPPGPREDRIEWLPRAGGGAEVEIDLAVPADLQVGALVLMGGQVEGARVRLVLRAAGR